MSVILPRGQRRRRRSSANVAWMLLDVEARMPGPGARSEAPSSCRGSLRVFDEFHVVAITVEMRDADACAGTPVTSPTHAASRSIMPEPLKPSFAQKPHGAVEVGDG